MTERMTAAQLRAFRAADGDTRAPRVDREGPIQRAIVALLDVVLPPDAIYHHSPNELDMAGSEAARQIVKARRLGTRKGWPDLEIIWRGRAYFMETKANGLQSDDQRAVQHDLERAGASYVVVRSVTGAQNALQAWGMIDGPNY